MHPGKVVGNTCNIGYGGTEKIVETFEVLVNNGGVDLDWQKTDGALPDHAVQAGEENGLALYVGRAYHENGTHPGKVFNAGSNHICNIGYGGKEVTYETFEVLVENKHQNSGQILSDATRCPRDSMEAVFTVAYIGTMSKNKKMSEGSSLVSNNMQYQTRVTDDGRLVVEEILGHGFCEDGNIYVFDTKEVWSNTAEKGDANLDYYLQFQEDGNLCIYSEQNGFVWCSMSNGFESHHFELTNIGHIEVVNDHGGEVWPD